MKNGSYIILFAVLLTFVVFGCTHGINNDFANKESGKMTEGSNEDMIKDKMMSEEGFMMKNGKMVMINEKTKIESAMQKDEILENGIMILTSGIVKYKNGTSFMLHENESIWMDGSFMKTGEMMKGEMMEKSIEIQLDSQNNSSQTGQAMLSDSGGKTKIVLNLNNYQPDLAQPAHIHLGACNKLGSVKYPLTSIVNGKSETMLNISVSQLLSGLPLAVNVHKSAAEANVYVSCGDIKNSMEKTTMMESYKGKTLAGTTSPYLEFNKEDYDKSLKENKKILLYFYASWCPLCKKEQPETMAAFNELNDPNLVGFRVHYNDGEDNNDAKALVQQFQVPYQHTKVIIKDGKQVLKAPDSWNKQRYLTELAKI